MIVHSKVFSELLSLIFRGEFGAFESWLLYVELLLVVVCGVIWLYKLSECLMLYDPLLIMCARVPASVRRAARPHAPPAPVSPASPAASPRRRHILRGTQRSHATPRATRASSPPRAL